MIIGFGFGSPLFSLLMLIITSVISYSIYKAWRSGQNRRSDGYDEDERVRRRAYYYKLRDEARRLKPYDVSDDEIERRLDKEFKYR